jgi:hypothetical protein
MDFNIKDYLKKFENFLPPETRMRRAIATAIKDATGIEIDSKNISVRGKTIFVNAPSIIKSELMMKQGKIIAKIKENKYIQGLERVA